MNSVMLRSTLAIVLLSFLGCGSGTTPRPKTYPVSGKILHKGKAISGATISFRLKDAPRTATGVTKEDGSFTLSTFSTNDGAIEGEHMVVIYKASAEATANSSATGSMSPDDYLKKVGSGKGGTQPPGSGSLAGELPAKYAKPETSGLIRAVVAGETNTFDFDLTD